MQICIKSKCPNEPTLEHSKIFPVTGSSSSVPGNENLQEIRTCNMRLRGLCRHEFVYVLFDALLDDRYKSLCSNDFDLQVVNSPFLCILIVIMLLGINAGN